MKKIFIKMINWYQKNISKWLESKNIRCKYYPTCSEYTKNIRCKYYPTCSEYTKQAIEKYGVIKGTGIGLARIIRCNPFSKGGYDPLK